jgi:low temperature requirement protein LtrA
MIKARPWRRLMVGRDHKEQHRQASWLELLFYLSFVVAVAQAAAQLEHAFAEGHPGSGLIGLAAGVPIFPILTWSKNRFGHSCAHADH